MSFKFILYASTSFCTEIGEKPFRARQLLQWIHQYRVVNFEDMTNLSKTLLFFGSPQRGMSHSLAYLNAFYLKYHQHSLSLVVRLR